jgi:hypothetical protein
MRKWRLKGSRHRSPDSTAANNGRLASAKHADVYGRKMALLNSDTAHVQPFVARFALHHRLAVVSAIADAPGTVAGEATTIGGGRCKPGAGRSNKGVGEGVIRGGIRSRKVGRGLCPALVVSAECVLSRTIYIG